MRSCQDWSFVCYARDGERRAVPQNGETSQKCGVYKSDCCWAEIVINVGSILPDCPNHPKFTTMWKPVVDGKISRVTGKKSESDPQRTLRIAVSSTRRLDGSNWRDGNKTIFMNVRSARAFSMSLSASRVVPHLKRPKNHPRPLSADSDHAAQDADSKQSR